MLLCKYGDWYPRRVFRVKLGDKRSMDYRCRRYSVKIILITLNRRLYGFDIPFTKKYK